MWIESGQMAEVTHMTSEPANLELGAGREIGFRCRAVSQAGAEDRRCAGAAGGRQVGCASEIIDKLVYRFNGAGYLKPGYAQVFVVPQEGGRGATDLARKLSAWRNWGSRRASRCGRGR